MLTKNIFFNRAGNRSVLFCYMGMHLFFYLISVLFLSPGCSKAKGTDKPIVKDSIVVKPPIADTVPKATYDLSQLEKCTLFNESPIVVNMQRQDRIEYSGIACSQQYLGVIFVHEDSGNGNEVFISNFNGDNLGKIVLDGVSNRDWEEVRYGPGPDNSKKYIYIAEIGDNNFVYSNIFIYRFAEPDLSTLSSTTEKHVSPEKIQLIYPKGSTNAESLLLDPASKDLYLATKEIGHSTLYVARYPQSTTSATALTPLASLPFDLLTSGDISRDGSEILVRNTGQIWYWKRQLNETIASTMLRKPQDAPYARNERQGEGVCFTSDGTGYLTNTEVKSGSGDKTTISFYKRR